MVSGAIDALIDFAAREPNKITTSVRDEAEGLGRGAKAQGYGVASIAVGEEWSFGVGMGSGSLGIFEFKEEFAK